MRRHLPIFMALCIIIAIASGAILINRDNTVKLLCDPLMLEKDAPAASVEAMCGKPDHKNITVYPFWSKVTQQWVYGHGIYIYIENGKLDSVQVTERE